jgi:hypothetical protein
LQRTMQYMRFRRRRMLGRKSSAPSVVFSQSQRAKARWPSKGIACEIKLISEKARWTTNASAHRVSVGAKNWALIQPLNGPFCTCTQSTCRLVTLNGVPFSAIATTLPFNEGVDRMFTLGRCTKRDIRCPYERQKFRKLSGPNSGDDDACVERARAGRLQQSENLHRRPLPPSRRRNAALVEARCNGP